MKQQVAVVITAAAVLLWGATMLEAQPGGRGRRGPGFEGGLKALDLTAAQQEKMEALRLGQAKQMAQLQADQKIARLELQEAMDQPNPDPGQVKAKVANLNRVRSQILEKRIDMRMKMNQILTPEQREKLKEMRGRRGKMRGFGRGPAGHGGAWRGAGPCPCGDCIQGR